MKLKTKNLKLKIFILLCFTFYVSCFAQSAIAGPTSTSYQIIDYGFGAGGIATTSGTSNYLLQGTVGEIDVASLSSATYIAWPGLTYTIQPGVPPAPTFTNPSNSYYNKLQLSINQGNNLSDTTYAISISTDKFVNDIRYVQADNTLGSVPLWKTYTGWQPINPVTIIGLTPGTTYYARVAAGRGVFTEGSFGPAVSAATINPTFTYSLQTTNQATPPFTVGIGVINPGQVTTSWQKIIVGIATNAYTGGTIYINDVNSGLKSTQTNHTIASVQNDLSSGAVSEGYGARVISVSQSAGNMELISPYNGADNNVGPVDTAKRPIADSSSAPVTGGQVSFELKAKAATTTFSASDYSDIVTVVASGSF